MTAICQLSDTKPWFHGIFAGSDSSTRVPTGARARARKRQRREFEPAMRPIHENFVDPATDSEDTTDSDMPELEDAEPLKRSESEDGLFRFLTDRRAVGRSAIRKKEKRRSRSTGWKHFQEPGGGHIDYSKVLCRGNALRALVCTLKKDQNWAQIARSLALKSLAQIPDRSVWPGIRPSITGHIPYLCESINDTGYETVEVNDSGLDSNYRGRGVCPFEKFQRDLHIVSGHEHMIVDMLDKDKHDRMAADVYESPGHILCFQEADSDFGKDNHNIPQRLPQHPRLLEAML